MNLILAIKAKQALLRRDGNDHSFKVAAREVVRELPNKFIQSIATQRSRTKLDNAESRMKLKNADAERMGSDYLIDIVENWEREIQRKQKPPTNEEAAKLYTVTNTLITAYADDRPMLQIIKGRCLTATKTHAAP